MFGYIYKITNQINGKIYIGKHSKSDNSLVCLDNSYWGSGVKIINAIKKYGKENFTREILCWCNSIEELNTKEIEYIKEFQSTKDSIGYNIAEGGEGGNLIKGYSKIEKEEWKHKISIATKNAMQNKEVYQNFMEGIHKRSNNTEWKEKLSIIAKMQEHRPMSDKNKEKLRKINMGNKYGIGNKSRTGMKNSEEMNKHISEGAKKVKHTEEWNKKVSKSLKGKKKSESHKQALRKPKTKYKWLLPNGEIVEMDASNGSRHKDWIRLN